MNDSKNPPLSAATLHILLALADEDLHGYGIIQKAACLCNVIRRKPATSFDNLLRDFGSRYVDGFTAPSFVDLLANAPFSE